VIQQKTLFNYIKCAVKQICLTVVVTLIGYLEKNKSIFNVFLTHSVSNFSNFFRPQYGQNALDYLLSYAVSRLSTEYDTQLVSLFMIFPLYLSASCMSFTAGSGNLSIFVQ